MRLTLVSRCAARPRGTRHALLRSLSFIVGCLAAAALGTVPLAAQQPLPPPAAGTAPGGAGVIRGHVVDEAGTELSGVGVGVEGTRRSALTDASGGFLIPDVAAGPHTLLARRPGMDELRHPVEVVAGDTVDVQIRFPVRPYAVAGLVVTATRTERAVNDLPVSTSVVAGDEVRATPAQTVDDVLRTVPGVNLPFENAVVAHPTSNFVSMRGLGGLRTLVLLDGVPLNDPFFGYVQWNKVPMELVERVEVVRGASASLFGTYALGGVINIITRKPGGDEAEAQAGYGSDATRRANVLASHALAKGLRLTVNGNYFNTDGYLRPYPGQIGPLDQRGRSDAQNVFLQLDAAPGTGSSAFLRGNFYRFEQNQGSPLGTDGQRVLDLAAGGTRLLPHGGELKASLFYERDRVHTENTDPITARGVDEFLSNAHHTPGDELGGSLQWSRALGGGLDQGFLTLGTDVRLVSGEDQADDYSAPGQFAFRELGGGKQRTLGVFGEGDVYATSALELLASARVDAWQNYDGHDTKQPGTTETFPAKSRTRLNPKLALRYHAGGGWTLRGSAYTAFNAPNLDQLYRPYSASGYAAVPNSQLDPETLTGGEAGIDYARGTAHFQLNAFQSTLRNVITYEAIAFEPIYTDQAVNLGASRSRGAELIADWQLPSGWQASASYTFTDARITENPDDPTVVGKYNPDTPRQALSGTLGYARAGRVSLFLRGRYLSRRYIDASNARTLSPHFVLDASASLPVHRDLELFLQGENLLNRLYVASSWGFDARGTPRQIFAGVRARLAAPPR